MKQKNIFNIMLLGIFLIYTGDAIAANSKLTKVAGMESVAISDESRPLIERQAIEGSPEAAHKLYEYYNYTGRFKEALYWAQIATENGHSNGPYIFGLLLMNDPDINNQRRAYFWLKKASVGGNSLANDLLVELEARFNK